MEPTTISNLRDLALTYLSLLGCIVLLVPLMGISLAFVSLGRLKGRVQSFLRALSQKVAMVAKTTRGIAQRLEGIAQFISRFLSRVSREGRK